MNRKIWPALAGLAVVLGVIFGFTGVAHAVTIPTAEEFQSGNWNLNLNPDYPVRVVNFSQPQVGTGNTVITVHPVYGQVIRDSFTSPDGRTFLGASVSGVCYLGCG